VSDQNFQRGRLLFSQGRYPEAVAELRLHLADASDDCWTHGLLALSLSELKQFGEATQHAQQAIHSAPDEAYGHFVLARVMLDRNRLEEARGAIVEAIRLDPFEADFFGILASLELQKSRWREALAAADQGLAIDPENGLCTNLRAQAQVKLGDRAAAAQTMGEALARRPDDAYTHANQGWALLHAGDPKQALMHFREAARIDPELEWARAGIVEAMQARFFIYRWMLAWFLWMSRLQPQMRWGLIIGAMFGQRIVRQLANSSPQLAPFLWPLLYAYMGFVLLTWLAPSLFNLLLRLDRFGRYALSQDQIRGANVLAVCLVVTLGFLIGYAATGSELVLVCTVYFGVLALPASAIFLCQAGWPRYAMMAITLGLLAANLFIFVVLAASSALSPQSDPNLLLIATALIQAAAAILPALPMALLASQFAAMYLTQVTPRR
jgi:tetratricopeptide (TPR) repeat protein/uncharacterized membrane protein (UPF0136 family)